MKTIYSNLYLFGVLTILTAIEPEILREVCDSLNNKETVTVFVKGEEIIFDTISETHISIKTKSKDLDVEVAKKAFVIIVNRLEEMERELNGND